MAKRKRKKKSIWVKAKNLLIALLAALLAASGVYTFIDSDAIQDVEQAENQTSPTKLSGKIVRVSDGDTVVLLDSTNTQHKIRLSGIDCPERTQDYGTKATDLTKKLCAGRFVKVEVEGLDKYQRTLGVVWVDGVNVNEELLKNGLAWQYKYNKSVHYKALESEARERKLNLWSMPDPIAPWDFRKNAKTK